MREEAPGILIVDHRIERSELVRLVEMYFGDMVKLVADVQRGLIAVGDEPHADAESCFRRARRRALSA